MANNIKSYVLRVKQLLCLEEAARYGSISKAASENGMKQPNLTSQIKALEKTIQKKVIFRHTKGVSLTENGYDYYTAACEIKNLIDNTENLSLSSNHMFGNIKLWTSDGLGSIYLTDCFNEFYGKYPKINLDINCSLEMPQLQEFDLALVFAKPRVKSLFIIDEHKMNFSLYASKEYINKYSQPKNLKDLQTNHIICNNSTYLAGWNKWNLICKKALHQTTVINSSNMLLNLIKSGVGLGLLPIQVGCSEENLVEIKDIAPPLSITFYLITKKEGFQNQKIMALVDIIKHRTLK